MHQKANAPGEHKAQAALEALLSAQSLRMADCGLAPIGAEAGQRAPGGLGPALYF